MKASEIVSRAKQIADIVNSDFYTFDDVSASLEESYKDIYNNLIEANDDFYLMESIISVTPAMSTGVPNEVLIPFPTGAYKVRYIDYQGNSAWQRMDRFAMSGKNNDNGVPRYRINGNNLWVVGALPASCQVRVGYYPEVESVTTQDTAIELGSTIQPYSLGLVGRGTWLEGERTAIYYNGTAIVADSVETGVVSTLRTAASVGKVYYYRGYVYWLEAGAINRGTTNLLGTVTPAIIVAATVTDFTIDGGVLYYSKGTETFSANLDGTGAVAVLATLSTDYRPTSWIAGGTMWIAGLDTLLPADALAESEYGVLRLKSGVLYDENGDILATEITNIGTQTYGNRLIINGNDLTAWSTVPDTDLIYPANAVYELMSYQIAMDIQRKAKMDYSQIKDRAMALYQRFMTQIKRDEGQPERVNNVYGGWGWGMQ